MYLRSMMISAQVVTILSMPAAIHAEVDSEKQGTDLIKRKAQLGYQMLDQLETDKAKQLKATLTKMVSPSNVKSIDLHLQSMDRLLAQIAELYRQRHDRKTLQKQLDKSRYIQSREEMMTLVETFEHSTKEKQSEVDSLPLIKQDYVDQLAHAESLADAGDYGQAITALSKAKNKIIEAISMINKNRTIEYKLVFESVAEEYEYELRRYASQKMLLQLAIHEKKPDSGRVQKIEQDLAIADALHLEARTHAQLERYREALSSQEMAVGKLNSVLRLMGYFF
ncbi:MAG: hypothetical protein JAZ17_20205 [Candidatus Thiodiazotropha endolucinida]|nr:hypothetical protein [Candidatus Thiodiazotropha taylori]MCG8095908.1 hypothetical protein [Candidatus Thiodiazotropha endolucinida]MCW4325586.1 hypothetical protein [Candidatus Thiodiazotropha taylori]